eukprot:c46399_g1_i1 orf=2-151(-)
MSSTCQNCPGHLFACMSLLFVEYVYICDVKVHAPASSPLKLNLQKPVFQA